MNHHDCLPHLRARQLICRIRDPRNGADVMTNIIISTKPLHLINDGGAFDPERHPNLMQPEREFNCIAHHVMSVSDVATWDYQRRMNDVRHHTHEEI